MKGKQCLLAESGKHFIFRKSGEMGGGYIEESCCCFPARQQCKLWKSCILEGKEVPTNQPDSGRTDYSLFSFHFGIALWYRGQMSLQITETFQKFPPGSPIWVEWRCLGAVCLLLRTWDWGAPDVCESHICHLLPWIFENYWTSLSLNFLTWNIWNIFSHMKLIHCMEHAHSNNQGMGMAVPRR